MISDSRDVPEGGNGDLEMTFRWGDHRLVVKPSCVGFVELELHEGSVYLGSFLLSPSMIDLLVSLLPDMGIAGFPPPEGFYVEEE